METKTQYLLRRLEEFVDNFGKKGIAVSITSKTEKSNIKQEIITYIKQLNKNELSEIKPYIKKVKSLKSLSYKEDHDLFNKLIEKISDYDEDIEMQASEMYPNSSGKQKLMQIDEQLIKQKISEEYTNDML